MKKLICLCLLFCCAFRSMAQNITAAEYFFNTDPGAGNGTPLPVGTSGPTVNFSATIPTASLASGFHTLAIRTKDAAGTWGPFESRGVYISGTAASSTPVVAAEYFIDNDPGVGLGTAIDIGLTGNTVNFFFALPTASLAPGFHTLAIRTKNTNGTWGLFETRGFYVTPASPDAGPITAAEYFIDADPGAGNGPPMAVGGSGTTVNFTVGLPITNLSTGFHSLAVRTKNADGVWGLFETRGFYISAATTDMGAITAAEYFLDTDPGLGNGAPLPIMTPGNNVSQNFIISIPRSMPNGQHLLAIRVKDVNGVWGLFELREITVSGFPLPLNWLSFMAKRTGDVVNLQWKTANEVNTSHFEIERSVNGIEFQKIGEVNAKSMANNNYDFDDNHPNNGLNYYRIKQVDKDNKFQYSVVTKLYFGDNSGNMKLFPQPSTTVLNIDFRGTGKEVIIQVYDAAGKMIVNERKLNTAPLFIATNNLARGTYWLVVSDGVLVEKGQFLKQ